MNILSGPKHASFFFCFVLFYFVFAQNLVWFLSMPKRQTGVVGREKCLESEGMELNT